MELASRSTMTNRVFDCGNVLNPGFFPRGTGHYEKTKSLKEQKEIILSYFPRFKYFFREIPQYNEELPEKSEGLLLFFSYFLLGNYNQALEIMKKKLGIYDPGNERKAFYSYYLKNDSNQPYVLPVQLGKIYGENWPVTQQSLELREFPFSEFQGLMALMTHPERIYQNYGLICAADSLRVIWGEDNLPPDFPAFKFNPTRGKIERLLVYSKSFTGQFGYATFWNKGI